MAPRPLSVIFFLIYVWSMIYLTGFSTYTKLYQLDPLIISKLELFSYIRYVLVFVKCFKNLPISLDSNSGFGTF